MQKKIFDPKFSFPTFSANYTQSAIATSNSYREKQTHIYINWPAKESTHFFQRLHTKIHPIEINNFVHRYGAISISNHIPNRKWFSVLQRKNDMYSMLVTESKVTKCNRMSRPGFTQKSMSKDEINQTQTTMFNNV